MIALLCGVVLIVLLGPWALAGALSYGRIHDVDSAPDRDVTIVLGAQVLPSGQPSAYLRGRLDVAANLYRTGKTKVILVSGDNREIHYNEPKAMKRYLIRRGVPAGRIVEDPAGLDTYDTCVRARRIFGVDQAIMVTQDYHEIRTVATCRMTGLDATGSPDRSQHRDEVWWKGWIREFGARGKMVMDVVSQRDPILGKPDDGVTKALKGS
ncbi:vancomycin high temperature exclusion protein [Cutibacterium sp.]|uniref:SanA/YdcF family protein n=1 Tax=Cutibacterium sp. TaxID=1912221 RepID=UPI0026DAE476|nr:ElyC/SanA/YdcF family protein [Cutibacterium sp.]MDO4412360.1 ElyC/SanA/YdcF family protein [Cutibacterium sp.]